MAPTLQHSVENQDHPGEEEARLPLPPKLAACAGAVVSNLNSHFLFYFEILPGISGMQRRAGCKMLSTDRSHWLEAGARGGKLTTRQAWPLGLGLDAARPGREDDALVHQTAGCGASQEALGDSITQRKAGLEMKLSSQE